MDAVKVTCEGAELLPLTYLKPLQGNLKILPEKNYKKLRAEILDDGFSFPFAVWHDKDKDEFHILDGHQRFETLSRMKEEGHSIPQLPVVFVEADNLNHAKKKLLAAASQYGTFQTDGLTAFLKELEGDLTEMTKNLAIPTFDDLTVVLEEKDMHKVSEHLRVSPGDGEFQEVPMPDLSNSGEPEFKQITFILHNEQLEKLKTAMTKSKEQGPFKSVNENSNGNALDRIVQFYLENC